MKCVSASRAVSVCALMLGNVRLKRWAYMQSGCAYFEVAVLRLVSVYEWLKFFYNCRSRGDWLTSRRANCLTEVDCCWFAGSFFGHLLWQGIRPFTRLSQALFLIGYIVLILPWRFFLCFLEGVFLLVWVGEEELVLQACVLTERVIGSN